MHICMSTFLLYILKTAIIQIYGSILQLLLQSA